MKRAISYVRISTQEQSNFSLSGQKQTNEDYARKRDIEILEFFEDNGYSASTFKRPDWKRLMQYLKTNHRSIDFIIVTKYDRLIRNAAEGLSTLEKIEARYNIKVLSVMENIGVPPHSPMFFKYRADMLVNAQLELLIIKDRTKFGIRKAKEQGRFLGTAPIGYKNARDAQNKPIIVLNEKKAFLVRRVFELYLAGKSFGEISREVAPLGFLKGHSAIKRVLANMVYAGFIQVPAYGEEKGKIVKGLHEAIVSQKDFEKANVFLSGGKPQLKTMEREEIPLRGLVKCECCEKPLTGGKSKSRSGVYYWYYRCNYCKGQNYSSTKAHDQLQEVFTALSLSKKEAEVLTKYAYDEFNTQQRHRKVKLDDAKELIQQKRTRLKSLEEKYLDDKIDDDTFRKWNSTLTRDIAGLRIQVENLSKDHNKLFTYFEQSLPQLTNLYSLYDVAKLRDKRELFLLTLGENVFKNRNGYRTTYINELFLNNTLTNNYLRAIKKGVLAYDCAKTPISSGVGNNIEPLLVLVSNITNRNKAA